MTDDILCLHRACEVMIRQAENLLKRSMHYSTPRDRGIELENQATGIIYTVRVLRDMYQLELEIPSEFDPTGTQI